MRNKLPGNVFREGHLGNSGLNDWKYDKVFGRPKIWFDVMKRDNYKCQYCGFNGKKFEGFVFLTVDHVVPEKQKNLRRLCSKLKIDSVDVKKNLVTACRFCNSLENKWKVPKKTRNWKDVFIAKKEAIKRKRKREDERMGKHMNEKKLDVIGSVFLLIIFISPAVIFAQDQLPSSLLPANASSSILINSVPNSFSSFKEAYAAGVNAANVKLWQDSFNDFNAALSLAQTDQDRSYAEKWILYVNNQLKNPTQTFDSGLPAISSLPGYKGLKWGTELKDFEFDKNYHKKAKLSSGVFCKDGIWDGPVQGLDDPINLLLADFRLDFPPLSDPIPTSEAASISGCYPKIFKSIYIKNDDVAYVFLNDQFFMIYGNLKDENFTGAMKEFKNKYSFVTHFNKSANGPVAGIYENLEFWEYESADRNMAILIKNITSESSFGSIAGSSNTFQGFIYVPKNKIKEIQDFVSTKLDKEKSQEAVEEQDKLNP